MIVHRSLKTSSKDDDDPKGPNLEGNKPPRQLGEVVDDGDCILQGNIGSMFALAFCLASAACILYVFGGAIVAENNPSLCLREGVLATLPETDASLRILTLQNTTDIKVSNDSVSTWLDSHRLLDSRVGKGRLGFNGHLGWSSQCISNNISLTPSMVPRSSFLHGHAHSLSMYVLPGSVSYAVFDLSEPPKLEKSIVGGRSSRWLITQVGFDIKSSSWVSRSHAAPVFTVTDDSHRIELWSSFRRGTGTSPEVSNALVSGGSADDYGWVMINVTGVSRLRLSVRCSKVMGHTGFSSADLASTAKVRQVGEREAIAEPTYIRGSRAGAHGIWVRPLLLTSDEARSSLLK